MSWSITLLRHAAYICYFAAMFSAISAATMPLPAQDEVIYAATLR